MFKIIVCFALVAAAYGAPEPSPKAKAEPGVLAAAYTSPVIAAPTLAAYSAPYAAPFAYSAYSAYPAYSAGYVAPSVYAAGYSPYAAPLIAV